MRIRVRDAALLERYRFPIVPHDFDAEDEAGRIARRKARWTPIEQFEEGS